MATTKPIIPISQTLPPDPTIPGLWWVQDSDGDFYAWHWRPQAHVWDPGETLRFPEEVALAGFRCIAPAALPDNLAQAVFTIIETRGIVADLSGRTLMDDECLLIVRETLGEVLTLLGYAVPPVVQP